MTSPTCGLPNVDIFDPVQCSKRWNACATQQQINVYLNGEIVRTQECLQLFKQAQAGVNEILDGKIKDHESRIKALESAEAELKSAQTALQKSFQEIQAGNTAYQTSVDNTLKLYQQSINALTNTTNTLTSEQQKMWNEINALKGSVDIAKIEQAIAGYDAIMAQTKSLIEENNTALQVQFKQLETKFATLQSELLGTIADNESATAKRFNDFTRTVTADIEAQNTRLNTFINTTTTAISELQKQVSEGSASVDKAVADFAAKIDKLDEAYKDADQKIYERLAAEEQARKDGDNALQGKLNTVEKTLTESVKASNDKLAQDLQDFETNMDLKLLQFQSDIRTVVDNTASGLDEKLSARIKSLEITEEANNKTTNARIDALEKEVGIGVDDRIADAAAKLNVRITKVESDAQTANAELESKLLKAIADGDAQQGSDLETLRQLVDTQGELITASRDEATLAWEKEVKDRIAGDEALQTAIDELGERVTSDKEETDKLIGQVNTRIDTAVAEAVEPISADIDTLKESDAKQWTTINNTVETVNQLRGQVDKMQETVDKVDPSNVDKLTEDLAALTEKVDAIDSTALEAVDDRLTLVEAKVGQIEGRNLKADSQLQDLDNVQKIHGADIDELKTTVKELVDSGTNPDDTNVTAEEFAEVKATAERASTVADANTAEIADVKAQAQKVQAQVDALPKPPVTKTAIAAAGQEGPSFLDKSGQAVRLTLNSDGTSVQVTYSALHHLCTYGMANGSTAAEAGQNANITPRGLTTLEFFPLKEGYNAYTFRVYIKSKTMYVTATEYYL